MTDALALPCMCRNPGSTPEWLGSAILAIYIAIVVCLTLVYLLSCVHFSGFYLSKLCSFLQQRSHPKIFALNRVTKQEMLLKRDEMSKTGNATSGFILLSSKVMNNYCGM